MSAFGRGGSNNVRPPPPPAPGAAAPTDAEKSRGGSSAARASETQSSNGTGARLAPPRTGRRSSTDVASLRAGLFGALKDIRKQNSDLQAGISDLAKTSGRTLPTPPKRGTPAARPATWLETTQKLAMAEAERDKYKSQVELVEKKLEDAQATIGALRARGSSKETEIRDQIQDLLKQRASELTSQVAQLESENKVLVLASGDQVALIASLRQDLAKEGERNASLTLERNDARAAAKSSSANAAGGATPEKLMAALEQALDQRDAAVREKDACTSARDAMMSGFEDASAMMVEYTNELEAKLGAAQTQCHNFQVAHLELKKRSDAFEGRLRVMETRSREQDALASDLLEDLEKQRQLSGGSDEEKARGIALLRAKERERKELAAAAVNLRKLSIASDSEGPLGEDQGQELTALLELPEGWSEATSPEGLIYYINHTDQTTTWVHPGVGADTHAGADGYLANGDDRSAFVGGNDGAGAAASAGGGGAVPTSPQKKSRKGSLLSKFTRRSSSSKTSST